MTLAELRKTYKDASRYYNQWNTDRNAPAGCQFAKDVMDLCNEVVRLRGIADEQNAEYSEFTLMPFGTYKGRRLADVPFDYFLWWLRQNPDRGIITLEWEHGSYANRMTASRKLRLYDYIKRKQAENDAGQEKK